jgi:hypothetical protein
MAITIGEAPDERLVRIEYIDTRGEKVIKTTAYSGSMTNDDLIDTLTASEALTNAAVVKASVLTSVPILGMEDTPTNALQNSVAGLMALTFTKADPINPTKTIRKEFVVPAYLETLQDAADWKPVTDNSDLNDLVALLEDNLTYKAGDGDFYPGGFSYVRAQSGFGFTTREIDGLPG